VLVAALLDLVLPACCAGCGAPGRLICQACVAGLAGPASPIRPRPEPAGFPPCRAVAAYDGPVRSLLLAYKERGRRDLARPLGQAIARAVAAHPAVADAGSVLLVPIPSQPAAVRRRGTDTTARLAAVAGDALLGGGIKARVRPVLRLVRGTADSAGLDAPARQANLSYAMQAEHGEDLDGAVHVIVDDLVTTGATLVEAARALAAIGRPGALAAVIAATARRSPVRETHRSR
jgi:predicted amidophosphoribosyltransferase